MRRVGFEYDRNMKSFWPKAPSPRRSVRTAVLLLALAGSLSACNAQTGIEGRDDLQIGSGRTAPPLSGPLVGGGEFSLVGKTGHPVVVDFWGSWCGPCRQEQPDINALYEQYAARGVVFVGVAMRETGTAGITAYQRELGVRYPSISDDGARSSDWSVAAPPTLVLVDGTGHVAKSYLGTVAGLSAALDRLLSAKA